MGVKTKVFGPVTWVMLEGLGRFYDEYQALCETKDNALTNPDCAVDMRDLFREFLFLLGYVVPCVYCRVSYREFTYALQPTNKHCDVNRMLHEREGGKRFVYHLHDRVNAKLRDQEREQFANSPTLLRDVNSKWREHMISYQKALKTRFPPTHSEKFWRAVIWFCGFALCDWRPDEACYIHRSFALIGQILLRSQDPEVASFANRYLQALSATKPLWQSEKEFNLKTRLDMIWGVSKSLFRDTDWSMGVTHEDFVSTCRAAIVGCVKE